MPEHVMLDLETWGTRPGSALRSIGAVVFSPDSTLFGAEFYANIDKQSCLNAGLRVDASTEAWWAQQSKEAQDALLVDPRPLVSVTEQFYVWFTQNFGEQVWSQGSNFDGVLWEAACAAVSSQIPWKFYNTRDTRTAYMLAGLDTSTIPRSGAHHNARDDAKHQARCVQAAYARIKSKEL